MLRYVTSTLTACVLATTVNVFAQEPAPAQSEKQQAAKETLTGCVMEAKTTDGGTAYVLNNAEGGSAKMYVLAGSTQPSVTIGAIALKARASAGATEATNSVASSGGTTGTTAIGTGSTDTGESRPPMSAVLRA